MPVAVLSILDSMQIDPMPVDDGWPPEWEKIWSLEAKLK